jgi:hypothetical protein
VEKFLLAPPNRLSFCSTGHHFALYAVVARHSEHGCLVHSKRIQYEKETTIQLTLEYRFLFTGEEGRIHSPSCENESSAPTLAVSIRPLVQQHTTLNRDTQWAAFKLHRNGWKGKYSSVRITNRTFAIKYLVCHFSNIQDLVVSILPRLRDRRPETQSPVKENDVPLHNTSSSNSVSTRGYFPGI